MEGPTLAPQREATLYVIKEAWLGKTTTFANLYKLQHFEPDSIGHQDHGHDTNRPASRVIVFPRAT